MKGIFLLEWIFSIALAAMAYSFSISEGNSSILVLSQGVALLIAIFGMFVPGYGNLSRRNILLLSGISFVLFGNILFNAQNYSASSVPFDFAVAHAVGIIVMLFALQWAASNLCPESLLRKLAVLLIPLIGLAITESLTAGGLASRQAPFGIHPNWWGELGFALTACALALPHWKARALPIAMVIFLFILVQSRGALLAAVSSIGMYVLLTTRWTRLFSSSRLALVSILIIAIGVASFIYQYRVIQAWWFLRDDVLLLHDAYRGTDTGLTGRLGGWQEALDVFMTRPVFGSGMDTLANVHNGFLRLAGEGGLVLLAAMLLLIGVGVREALRTRNHLAISIMIGYLVYVMTYPRMLNMNLASVVFYLSLFPWKISYARHLRQRPKAVPHQPTTTSAFIQNT